MDPIPAVVILDPIALAPKMSKKFAFFPSFVMLFLYSGKNVFSL